MEAGLRETEKDKTHEVLDIFKVYPIPTAVQITGSFLGLWLILLGFWMGNRPFQNQVHHRDTEGTEGDFL